MPCMSSGLDCGLGLRRRSAASRSWRCATAKGWIACGSLLLSAGRDAEPASANAVTGRVDVAAAARLVADLEKRPEAGDPQQRKRAAGAALQEREAQRAAAAQVRASLMHLAYI